jgi:tripartite-type tricarboxylate transporter receptor subunit TctC
MGRIDMSQQARPAMRMRIGAAFAVLIASTGLAHATDYACAPARIIVPFPPGGSNDVAARILAERLGALLKQTFIVESRPGATGNIGTMAAVNAPPDGCTLLVNGAVIATFPASFAELRYDPLKDLVPIGGIGNSPTVIVTGTVSKAKTAKELIAWSKEKSGGLTYSTAGYGLLQHLATEEIAQRTGAKFVHVAYKGGPESATDIITGRLDFGSLSAGSIVQFLENGQLRPLAVIQNKRTALAPEIPTIVEAGLAPLDANVLYMLFAPRGTPKTTVQLLSDTLEQVIRDPAVQARLMHGGFEPTPINASDAADIMRETAQTWAPVIKRLNIRLE